MAQFRPYKENIKVNPSLLKPYADAEIRGREKRLEIFNRYGLTFDHNDKYCPLEQVLQCFEAIHNELGEMNLFLIGRLVMKNTPFQCKNFKDAIEQLNVLYHINHTINDIPMYNPHTRTFMEGIGEYKVIEFNEEQKKLIVFANTHFSSKSDEGAIVGLLENFLPPTSKRINIRIDTTKERRTLGADSCTYIITW